MSVGISYVSVKCKCSVAPPVNNGQLVRGHDLFHLIDGDGQVESDHTEELHLSK